MNHIAQNIQKIRQDITQIAKKNGRNPNEITLLAVSKFFPAGDIEQAILAGQSDFGENRVQEILEKFPHLRTQYPNIRVNLIGPLQSNKVKKILPHIDGLHSLDRLSLLDDLAQYQASGQPLPQILVQVNVGLEEQKSGVLPADLPQFMQKCTEYAVKIDGLMCIPPVDKPATPYFIYLRQQCDILQLPICSMGMSADYAQAIACGSNMVRVGSAIFGARHYE